MIESHFGLRRRPFPVTPDGSCYYPATGHEDAALLPGPRVGERVGTNSALGRPRHRQNPSLPRPFKGPWAKVGLVSF